MSRKRLFWPALVALTAFFTVVGMTITSADTLNGDYLTGNTPQGNLGTLLPGDSVTSDYNYFTLTLNCNGQSHAVADTDLAFTPTVMNMNIDGTGGGELGSIVPTLHVPSTWPADSTLCSGVSDATGTMTFAVNVPSGATSGPRSFKIKLDPSDSDVNNLDNLFVNYCVTTCDTSGGGGGNTPPTVGAGGPYSGDEGANVPISGTANDPDSDPLTYLWTYALVTGSGTCSFGDATLPSTTVNCEDNGTFTLTLTATGDPDGPVSDTAALTVSNVAPTISTVACTPCVINEGDSTTISGTFTDPGVLDTHTVTIVWGDGSTNTVLNLAANVLTFSAPSHTYVDDNPTGTSFDYYGIDVTVTDKDGGSSDNPDPLTTAIKVSNVNPVATAGSVSVDPWTGVGTASISFTDVGVKDTHTATFTGWSGGSAPSVTEPSGSTPGTASSTKTFAPGCYTLTVTGYVTDDDTGVSGTRTLADGTTQYPVYSLGFLAPIKDGERNIAKYGNVVPVKVAVTNPCTNTMVSVNLFVSYYQGDGDDVDSTPVLVGESVATPDGTSGQMRPADGFYIFNFSTKPLSPGKDYTIRIWKDAIGTANGGTVLLDAVLTPKK